MATLEIGAPGSQHLISAGALPAARPSPPQPAVSLSLAKLQPAERAGTGSSFGNTITTLSTMPQAALPLGHTALLDRESGMCATKPVDQLQLPRVDCCDQVFASARVAGGETENLRLPEPEQLRWQQRFPRGRLMAPLADVHSGATAPSLRPLLAKTHT